MEIALKESLETAVRRRAEASGYKSPDDYVEALVLADLDRAAAASEPRVYPELSPDTLAKIQVGLRELDAGLGIPVDEAFWEEMHRRVRQPEPGA